MSDETEKVGSVEVKISSRAIHKAVRNILANEMNFDPEAVKEEIRIRTAAEIHQRVKDHIDSRGYGSADLHTWVKNALARYEQDIKKLIKEAIAEEVRKALNEEIETLIEGYVREGLEIRVGWQKKAKVRLAVAKGTT